MGEDSILEPKNEHDRKLEAFRRVQGHKGDLGLIIEIVGGRNQADLIEEVVRGPGHFLGSEQTLNLMDSEYVYPELGDRLQPTLWEELGAQDIRERARANVQQILSTHYPNYIDPAVDAKIRDTYNIVLDPDAMKPGNGRW